MISPSGQQIELAAGEQRAVVVDRNCSPSPRWSLICCYNTADNSLYRASRHPAYTRLEKIEDAQILSFAKRAFRAGNRDALMTAGDDPSVGALKK